MPLTTSSPVRKPASHRRPARKPVRTWLAIHRPHVPYWIIVQEDNFWGGRFDTYRPGARACIRVASVVLLVLFIAVIWLAVAGVHGLSDYLHSLSASGG